MPARDRPPSPPSLLLLHQDLLVPWPRSRRCCPPIPLPASGQDSKQPAVLWQGCSTEVWGLARDNFRWGLLLREVERSWAGAPGVQRWLLLCWQDSSGQQWSRKNCAERRVWLQEHILLGGRETSPREAIVFLSLWFCQCTWLREGKTHLCGSPPWARTYPQNHRFKLDFSYFSWEDHFSIEDWPNLAVPGALIQEQSRTQFLQITDSLGKGGAGRAFATCVGRMEQNSWAAMAKGNRGQGLYTCSLTEDVRVGDIQGKRTNTRRTVQKKSHEKRTKPHTIHCTGLASLQATALGHRAEPYQRKSSKETLQRTKNKT